MTAPLSEAVCLSQEMMETAVILVVELLALPGQGVVDLKQLCRSSDEARIRWGASATGRGLQLTRWSTTRWFLCSSLGDLGLKHRPVVREVADCALEMQKAWREIMKEQKLLFHTFSAGLVVGPAFVTYDGGKFLSGLGGRAFDTALDLVEEARKADPCSCIMVTDACVEALRHTHTLYLEGTNYRLSEAMKMPFDYTAGKLIGHSVDFDPVSPGPTISRPMPSRFAQMRSQALRAQSPPKGLIRSGSNQEKSQKAAVRGNTPPSASLKGPKTPPKKSTQLKKSNLSVAVPSPAASSRDGSNTLIGYGPNAIVTPGGFGKPFHTEASYLTQPSNAGKLVKQKSLKSLKDALESDMPLTPGGTVLAPWDSPVKHDDRTATNAAAKAGDKGRRHQSHAPGSRHSRFNSRPKSKLGDAAKADDALASTLPAEKSSASLRSSSTMGSTLMKTPVATLGNVRHSNLNTQAPLSSDIHQSKLVATNGRREPQRRAPSAPVTGELSGYKPHPIHGQTVRNQNTKLNARQLARQIMGTTAPTPVSSTSNIFGGSQTLPNSLMEMQRTNPFRIAVPQERGRAGYSNLTVVLSPLTITPTSSGPASAKTPVRSYPSTTLPSLKRNDNAAHQQQEPTDTTHPPPKAKITATPSRVMFSAEYYDDDEEEEEEMVPDILDADGDGLGLDYAPGHTTVSMGPADGLGGENQSNKSYSPDNDEGAGSDLALPKEDSTSTVGTNDGRDPNPRAGVYRGAAAARSKHLREAASTMDTLRVSKDCGSLRGAQDYVSAMPPGTMVLIMSVAGQVRYSQHFAAE